MQYQSEINGQDIVSQTLWLCDASTTDYSVNDITRNANIAYHEAVSIIQGADGTWQYDDSNNTTIPIGTTTVTSGQQNYTLDDTMLEIEMIEIKDTSGTWTLLTPVDIDQLRADGQSISEYKTTNGIPTEYDKRGRSLVLYPTPNFTQSASLKVHFKRPANIFAVTDTTKEPGFNDTFHPIIPLKSALSYCLLYKPERINVLREQIAEMKMNMEAFYGRRSKDERKGLRPRVESNK